MTHDSSVAVPVVAATYPSIKVDLLAGETTIHGDFGYSKSHSDGRLTHSLAKSTFGQDQLGKDTIELNCRIRSGPGVGDRRAAISEKIMSDDPGLTRTDRAKMNETSGVAKTAAEQTVGNGANFGMDFSIFFDGSDEEMLF